MITPQFVPAVLLPIDRWELGSPAPWQVDSPLLPLLAITLLLYLAGVAALWRRAGTGAGISAPRALAGLAGFTALALALVSPLETLSGLFFSAHMIQHLLIVVVAAPLLVAAMPAVALLWLLPSGPRKRSATLWRRGRLHALSGALTAPAPAAVVLALVLWGWHLPAAYGAALRSETIHALEHGTLLAAALAFWWSLLRPAPGRSPRRLAAPLLLFATAVHGGVLGALLTVAPEPLYAHYQRVAAALGYSTVADQQLAGLLMWVPPGFVYLTVACWLLYQALAPPTAPPTPVTVGPSNRREAQRAESGRVDDRDEIGLARLLRTAAPGLLLALVPHSSAHAQVLRPVGPDAAGVAQLFWVMLVIAVAVCLLVYALFLIAVLSGRRRDRRGEEVRAGRRREAERSAVDADVERSGRRGDDAGAGVAGTGDELRISTEDPARHESRTGGTYGRAQPPLGSGPFVVLGGIVLPIVVLVPLLFWSLGLTTGVAAPTQERVVVDITGHQWWWEVEYADHGVTDANEIHVPVGVPVQLRMTSEDVIHSFWAPALQGKIDLIPGSETSLWFEAEETGVYSAKCAEFCGAQHANMRLLIVAEPLESFNGWIAERQGPARTPRDQLAQRGQEVFLTAPCAGCHTISGTAATGDVGPDLSHVGSRLTLGAGTVANNRGNLGGWIANSQAIKPGNKMPPMYLESEDLIALIAYLESLE